MVRAATPVGMWDETTPPWSDYSILLGGGEWVNFLAGSLKVNLFANALTVHLFMKTASTGGLYYICGDFNNAGTNGGWVLYQQSGNLVFWVEDGNGNRRSSTFGAVPSGWANIIAIYTGGATGSLKLWVDGVARTETQVNTNTLTSTQYSNNTGRLGNAANPSLPFQGNLCELAVWNTDQSANVGDIYTGTRFDLRTLATGPNIQYTPIEEGDDPTTSNGFNSYVGDDGTGANMEAGDLVQDSP